MYTTKDLKIFQLWCETAQVLSQQQAIIIAEKSCKYITFYAENYYCED